MKLIVRKLKTYFDKEYFARPVQMNTFFLYY